MPNRRTTDSKTVRLASSPFLLGTLTLTCDVFWTSMLQPHDGKSLFAGLPVGSKLSERKLGLLSKKGDVLRDSG